MRAFIKQLVKLSFLLLVSPLLILYKALNLVLPEARVFPEFSQLLGLVPGIVGVYMRAAFYHVVCPGTAADVSIGFLTILSHENTSLSKGVYIGVQANIGMCSIGRNCLLGSGVHVLSGKNQHDFSNPSEAIKHQSGKFTKITIKEDTWIGNNAVIMADVGQRCVVAAGAVVTSKVDDGCIVAGNPARFVRRIDQSSDAEASREAL